MAKRVPKGKKGKVTVTVDRGLLEWIDKEVETFRFRNRSHAFEYALAQLKDKPKDKEQT